MTDRNPPRLLSMADWHALPEDSTAHYELQEGVLIVTPGPIPEHARASARLWRQLDEQLPDWLEALPEIDVCLDPEFPPTVRVPDIVVTRTIPLGGKAELGNVLVAIEIISPGSRRTDTVMKPTEYAEAGIPFYWVVDLDTPVSLTAYHLAGEFGYQEAPAVTGTFSTEEPAPLRVDLEALSLPR